MRKHKYLLSTNASGETIKHRTYIAQANGQSTARRKTDIHSNAYRYLRSTDHLPTLPCKYL